MRCAVLVTTSSSVVDDTIGWRIAEYYMCLCTVNFSRFSSVFMCFGSSKSFCLSLSLSVSIWNSRFLFFTSSRPRPRDIHWPSNFIQIRIHVRVWMSACVCVCVYFVSAWAFAFAFVCAYLLIIVCFVEQTEILFSVNKVKFEAAHIEMKKQDGKAAPKAPKNITFRIEPNEIRAKAYVGWPNRPRRTAQFLSPIEVRKKEARALTHVVHT